MTLADYDYKCARAQDAIMAEYYCDQPPTKGAPAAYPAFPEDVPEEHAPASVPFRYIELEIPGEGRFLAVLTPFQVEDGPGRKYRVVPA